MELWTECQMGPDQRFLIDQLAHHVDLTLPHIMDYFSFLKSAVFFVLPQIIQSCHHQSISHDMSSPQ